MKKPLLHLAQRAFNVPLLITKSKFDAIMAGIGPRLGYDPELHASAINIESRFEPGRVQLLPEQVLLPKAGYPGAKWSDFGDYAVTANGTAIIPIHGTLVRRADWIDAMSGMRSYESIRADVSAALNDKYVARLLLDCDSGGGEVNDCFDLADMIYASRSIKPIHSFANDYAFSAMYAIASSAQTVSVTRVGGTGSIGVICVHCDQSEFDKKIGTKYTAIYSGKHKNDFSQHEPLSKGAEAEGQREIDRLDAMFDVLVARNRNLKVEQVDAMEAAIYYGAEGVAAGLADQVVTFDELMAQIDLPSTGNTGTRLAAVSTILPAEASASTDLTAAGEGAMPQSENKAATADETMPEECKTDEEPDPDDPDEEDEDDDNEDEEEKPMETKSDNPGAAPAESKPNLDAAKISRMCIAAGRPELAAQYVASGLTFDAALDELDKVRIAEQPRINSARRASVTGNAMAELESQARAEAGTKGITRQQAFARALTQNPQAYTQFLQANPQLDGGKTRDQFEAFQQQ